MKKDKDEEDKYMQDTNTDYSGRKTNAATWVMIAWIVIFVVAIGIAIWLGVR